MRPAGKTALLLYLIILLSPLFADPQPDDAPPVSDGLFFFEELFIIEEALSFDEALMGNETGETLPDEEMLLSEETEETPAGEEELLSEASEDMPAGEDIPLDDAAFFFEAPPLIFEVPTFEIRSLDAIYPHFSRRQKMMTMSNTGLRYFFLKDEPPLLVPHPDSGIDLYSSVMQRNPSHYIEALKVLPYNGKELDLLDIYNALGRIEKLQDYPVVINGDDFYVITESTRIESARKRKPIPDPAPAVTLPFSETMYVCLKEANFGNLFIRTDISISAYGITYSMTNFTDVRYFLLPIMKAERFVTIIYLEPVKEGILIYSMTGFYLPGFIAEKVNLTPSINRRIEIFIRWITDGLRQLTPPQTPPP